MSRRRLVQAVLACSAAAGLVGAHALAYVIALPDAGLRATMLRATGHGYFSTAVVVATVAAIFGALAAVALGFRREGGEPVTPAWRHAALRIAFVQTAGFVVLEVAERAAANISPLAVNPRLAGLGVAVQVFLACVAALVLTLIAHAAAAVSDALLRRRVGCGSIRRRIQIFDALGPRPVFPGALHARAPPLSAR